MRIRKDIVNQTPEIGDTIIFNPPKYKGMVVGECIGFSNTGLPKIKCNLDDCSWGNMRWEMEHNGCYTPKTGFVCVKGLNLEKTI